MPVHKKLRGHGAGFLSPTRLAFYTLGSTNCRPVPIRLSVETPDAIRIRLKEQEPSNGICLANLVSEPVVIAIDPQQINVHRRLTIHLDLPRAKQPLIFTALPLT